MEIALFQYLASSLCNTISTIMCYSLQQIPFLPREVMVPQLASYYQFLFCFDTWNITTSFADTAFLSKLSFFPPYCFHQFFSVIHNIFIKCIFTMRYLIHVILQYYQFLTSFLITRAKMPLKLFVNK